jgi:methyl-accepting chemotaxis protein
MRSTEAAKNTQDLISNSTTRITEATDICSQVTELMEKNSQTAQKVAELMSEISAASEEQSKGLSQINIAISEMDKITQQNAAGAEESAGTAKELTNQTEYMAAFVKNLVMVVDGYGSSTQNFASGNHNRDISPRQSGGFGKTSSIKHAPASLAPTALPKKGRGKEIDPNQVIPMDDEDFKDF